MFGGDERGEFVQNDCIFCKIAAKEIPVKVIYEDDHVFAFPDINPMAPVHILVIPKQHFDSLLAVQPEEMSIVAQAMAAIPAIAKQAGIADGGGATVPVRDLIELDLEFLAHGLDRDQIVGGGGTLLGRAAGIEGIFSLSHGCLLLKRRAWQYGRLPVPGPSG